MKHEDSLLVENVPGILTNRQSIWPEFHKKLQDLGYNKIVYGIIDMSHYGVPQSRERIIIVGVRNDEDGYTNMSTRATVGYFNDLSEQGCVFVLD